MIFPSLKNLEVCFECPQKISILAPLYERFNPAALPEGKLANRQHFYAWPNLSYERFSMPLIWAVNQRRHLA